jgi:hypothetical protein
VSSHPARTQTEVVLDWHRIKTKSDPHWFYTCAIYAYLAPRGREVLYIGKADGCTVRRRWLEKDSFWSDLERQRNIMSHDVIVAEVLAQVGCRLTRELLCDVESLLIWELKPWGNIQCRSTRIQRPGLVVSCRGAWPGARRRFRDQ